MGRLIIFGHVLASWELDQVEYGDYELLELRELLVEQRGIEPLTSALRIRRPAKT